MRLYTGGEYISELVKTSEGGYAFIGTTKKGDTLKKQKLYNVWVVKLNAKYDTVWQKIYGGSNYDVGVSIKQTTDKGFILGCGSQSKDGDVLKNIGYGDYWILKLDSNGKIQWQSTFGTSKYWEDISSIIQTKDGGYLANGTGKDEKGAYAVKMDKNGKKLWDYIYSDQSYYGYDHDCSYGFDVLETTRGKYIFASSIGENDPVQGESYTTYDITETDSNGYDVSGTTIDAFQESRQLLFAKLISTSDGGFAFACLTEDLPSLIKLDKSYNQDWWYQSYNGGNHVIDVLETSNSFVLLSDNGYSAEMIDKNGKFISETDITDMGYFQCNGGISDFDNSLLFYGWYMTAGGNQSKGGVILRTKGYSKTIFPSTFSGVVSQSDGKILANSEVYLMNYNAASKAWVKSDSTISDSKGNYFISTYDTLFYLVVKPNSSYWNELPAYYSNSLTLSNAKKIYLPKEYDSIINFSSIRKVNTIHGNITQYYGQPLKNSTVYLMKHDTATHSVSVLTTTYTDSLGNYSFSTAYDTFYILVSPSTQYPDELPTYYFHTLNPGLATEIILGNKTDTSISFSTIKKYGIKGTISQSNGKPMDSSTIFLIQYNATTNSVTKLDSKSTDSLGHYSFSTIRDSVGLYVLPNAKYKNELTTFYKSSLSPKNLKIIQFNNTYDTVINFSTLTQHTINGKVLQSNGSPLKNSLVYVQKFDSLKSITSLIDSVYTDTSGMFTSILYTDSVKILAVPGSSVKGEYPTYYTSSLNIKGSNTLVFGNKSVISIVFKTLLKPNLIHGKVSQSNLSSLKNSKVYLVKYNAADTTISAVDSTVSDTSGNYSFSTYEKRIHLYAFPDIKSFPGQMPTYYNSSLIFNKSVTLNFTNWTDTNINFSMIKGNNPGGTGFIGGKVSYCKGCKKFGSGLPVANLKLVLINKNKEPVTYTFTASDGTFSFSNLSLQDYEIWADAPNFNNDTTPKVKLTTATPSQSGLEINMYPTYLELIDNTSIDISLQNEIKLYPNPTTGILNLEFSSPVKEDIEIKVYDMLGQLCHAELVEAPTKTKVIDLSGKAKGVYMIECVGSGGVVIRRVVVE